MVRKTALFRHAGRVADVERMWLYDNENDVNDLEPTSRLFLAQIAHQKLLQADKLDRDCHNQAKGANHVQ
jgi:hypothetical protein